MYQFWFWESLDKNWVQHGVKVAHNYAKNLHFLIHCGLVISPPMPQLLKTCTPGNVCCQMEDLGLMTNALTVCRSQSQFVVFCSPDAKLLTFTLIMKCYTCVLVYSGHAGVFTPHRGVFEGRGDVTRSGKPSTMTWCWIMRSLYKMFWVGSTGNEVSIDTINSQWLEWERRVLPWTG